MTLPIGGKSQGQKDAYFELFNSITYTLQNMLETLFDGIRVTDCYQCIPVFDFKFKLDVIKTKRLVTGFPTIFGKFLKVNKTKFES